MAEDEGVPTWLELSGMEERPNARVRPVVSTCPGPAHGRSWPCCLPGVRRDAGQGLVDRRRECRRRVLRHCPRRGPISVPSTGIGVPAGVGCALLSPGG